MPMPAACRANGPVPSPTAFEPGVDRFLRPTTASRQRKVGVPWPDFSECAHLRVMGTDMPGRPPFELYKMDNPRAVRARLRQCGMRAR